MLCTTYRLGQIEYGEAYELQKELVVARAEGKIENLLLLLEHPPVFTIGKSGKQTNILINQERLTKEDISIFATDRGGDVTYHGPGQIVIYPIIDLKERDKDIHRYVHELEEVIIGTVNDFEINAGRDETHPGVWVDNKELAAIGVRITRWVTMHGFALNVNPKMEHFSFINPCGFSNRKATSLSELLNKDISIEEVIDPLINHFAEVFQAQIIWGSGMPGRVLR